jgi:uncharacterized repeat protein (TIGR01451 family)
MIAPDQSRREEMAGLGTRGLAALVAVVFVMLVVPGTAGAFSGSPNPYDFGSVALNTTASKDIDVTLDAGYRISIAADNGGGLNAPYSFDFGTCTSTTVGPTTCHITESFTPTVTGATSGGVRLVACDTNSNCENLDLAFTGTGVNPFAITTASLPSGTYGAPYPATTITTSGGTSPDHFVVTSGSLPPGLAIGSSTGTITGTPTAAGTFTFTITATDSGTPTPQTASQTYTITVTGVADLAVAIAAPSTPVQQKKPFALTITVRNLGPTSAGGVVVTDAVPAGAQFASVAASQGSCTAPPVGSTGTIVCSLGALANGANATITLTVTPTGKKTTTSDTASATQNASAVDPVSANNSATVAIQIK